MANAFSVKSLVQGAAFAGLNEFLGSGREGGYARPNRFEIIIVPPSGVRGTSSKGGIGAVMNKFTSVLQSLSSGPSGRSPSFMCESFSIPGKNLISAPYTELYGPEREIVNGMTFGEISSTFYLSSDLKEKTFFDSWQSVAGGTESGGFALGYYHDYVGKIEIFQLDENDNRTYGCELVECFPKTVTDLSVSQGVATDIQKLSVTWQYRHWINTEFESGSDLGTRIVDAVKNTVTRRITSQIPSVLRRL
jgi:hypothetical protein